MTRISKRLNIDSPLFISDPRALSNSKKLSTIIKDFVNKQGGAVGFDQYMELALYHEDLGYYCGGSQKFGVDGDFITAPEISTIFSRCLASQCIQILDDLKESSIFEIGAGDGVMAKDLLLEMKKRDSLPKKYFILEVSAELRKRQKKLLKRSIPQYISNIIWLNKMPKKKIKGIILANEVLDALPVVRFKKKSQSFKEMQVACISDKFIWVENSANSELTDVLIKLEEELPTQFPENYISEININLKLWLDSIQSVIEEGVLLFIDYGYSASEYYHPEKSDGNLACHFRHHLHNDPFFYPGLQDITSSVNFTAIAQHAEKLGLDVSGYCNQTYFLFGCGLEDLVCDVDSLDIKSQTILAQQLRMLTMPDEMGERFKVMALTKKYNKKLLGFSIMNQISHL